MPDFEMPEFSMPKMPGFGSEGGTVEAPSSMPSGPPIGLHTDWNSSLLGCFDDCGLCVLTWCLPCVTFGKNAEASHVTSCCLGGLALLVPCVNLYCLVKVRGAIRHQHRIEGSLIMDVLLILLCSLCTITQEARELKHHHGGAPAIPRI